MPRRRESPPTVPLAASARPPETYLGEYRLVAPVARGGTATVYLAEHQATRARVALKVLDPFYAARPDVVASFLDEHAIASRARHPGLLAIDEAGRDRLPYLVMEYLDGENLGALADREYVQLEAIVAIGAAVADALAALHAGGAIHCDVKPDNIMVLCPEVTERWPRVKVIDFGVARRVEATPFADGTIAGTPAYMAPEQWRGEPTPRSDVYALGITLYELVGGEPPFRGSLPQLMAAHEHELAPRPSTLREGVPAELERMIVRALAKDPAMRPSMAELAATLLRCREAVAPATDERTFYRLTRG